MLQGKTAKLSTYDPLDLFSGDPARVAAALQALLREPQNNLRLFRDGQIMPFECAPGLGTIRDFADALHGCQPVSMRPEQTTVVLRWPDHILRVLPAPTIPAAGEQG